ncbi:peptidase inhibitor family I36 protein [Actinoplanes sp. TRM 88003]|uniref:Peptidase inhibitor family I36 protein n=1 Tax=Paractinoplanes aksuensis TaxID=2939490 RepID=A0ABT1E6B9_9ACTN|nr:peptidase inhibitor family I36 protein [Actinoplanes aksuensis]MCO8277806.1 peptidase inhibitor family I36 protein [Actinoplanes aksuensis]
MRTARVITPVAILAMAAVFAGTPASAAPPAWGDGPATSASVNSSTGLARDMVFRAPVELYEHADFQGRRIDAWNDRYDMRDGGNFDNRVSSIKNFGTGVDICLYPNYGYQGWPLRIPHNTANNNLANVSLPMNDNVSSLRGVAPGTSCG